MAITKLYTFKEHAISFSMSDVWYEVVDYTKRYEYFSLTGRIKHENICIVTLIVLFFKISLFIKFK